MCVCVLQGDLSCLSNKNNTLAFTLTDMKLQYLTLTVAACLPGLSLTNIFFSVTWNDKPVLTASVTGRVTMEPQSPNSPSRSNVT